MDASTARALLEDEARRLDALVAHADPPLAAEPEPDRNDAGSTLVDHEVSQAVHERVAADRAAVAAALARLDAGTYGSCASCGRDITDERLEAVPATRFCIDHEQEAETLVGEGVDAALGGADASDLARREAQRNLDLVPDEDHEEDDLAAVLDAEELAVHVRRDR